MTFLLARDCLLATLAFQAVISIITLSLRIGSYNFIKAHSGGRFALNNLSGEDTGQLVFALPRSLNTSALNLVVVSSIALLVTACTVSTFTLCAWSDRKRVSFEHLPPFQVLSAITDPLSLTLEMSCLPTACHSHCYPKHSLLPYRYDNHPHHPRTLVNLQPERQRW